jgi:hypothetical protein
MGPKGITKEAKGNFYTESWQPKVIDSIIRKAVCGNRFTHQANGRDAYRVTGKVWTTVDGVPSFLPPPRHVGESWPKGGYGPPAPTDTVVVIVDPSNGTNFIITAYPE